MGNFDDKFSKITQIWTTNSYATGANMSRLVHDGIKMSPGTVVVYKK